MATGRIQLTGDGAAVPVYATGFDEPLAVTNVGTVGAYVDDAPFAPYAGRPLGPGSTIVWDAGRPLYAAADLGGTTVVYTPNTGIVFDPAQIGNQVAVQLLAGGALAQQIADRLVASPLSTDTGVHTAGQILAQNVPDASASSILATGVQIIDQPAVLLNAADTGSLVNTGGAYSTPSLDTSRAASVRIDWQTTFSPNTRTAPPDFVVLELAWDPISGNPGARDVFIMYPNSDPAGSLRTASVAVPAKGAALVATFTNHAFGGNWRANVTVRASQRPLDAPRILQRINTQGGWSADSDPAALRVATPNLTPFAIPGFAAPIPIRPGPARITLLPNAVVTAAGRFLLLDHLGNWASPSYTMPAAATTGQAAIEIPCNFGYAPTYLASAANPTGPTGILVSITWER